MADPTSRPRRYAKACDACHAKKTKCEPNGTTCQICRRTGQSCSFTRREKGPRKKSRRGNDLSALEERLKNMEALLRNSRDVAPAQDDERQQQHQQITPVSEVSSPEITIAHRWPQTRQGQPFPFAPKAQAIHLARGFFASCNLLFPVFNANIVLERMSQEWPPEKEPDLVWWTTAVVVLLYAHRLRAMSYPAEAEADNKEASRYLSEALEVAPKLPYGKPSLESVQVLLAVASILRGTAMPDPARMFISCAIHTLQDLDAHKEETLGSPYADSANDRARVFWVAYVHDKNMAFLSGKPPVMHESEIGRLPPKWSNVEGFNIVRSLDGTLEANFLVIAHGLAVAQSQVWSNTQSASLFVTREHLVAAQTALNPQLEAWKNSLPFIFKPDCLVTQWPKHVIIYLVLLHFQYFQTLVELNKEPPMEEHDTCPLNADCSTAAALRSCSYSTAPFVVEAARDALDLASLTPRGNFQHVWLFFDYSICAVLTLLINGIIRPLDASLSNDFRRVDEWLQVVDLLASSSERSDLLEKKEFLVSMRSWALKRIKEATADAAAAQARASFASLGLTTCDWYESPLRRDWSAEESQVDVFPLDQWHGWWDWEHLATPAGMSLS